MPHSSCAWLHTPSHQEGQVPAGASLPAGRPPAAPLPPGPLEAPALQAPPQGLPLPSTLPPSRSRPPHPSPPPPVPALSPGQSSHQEGKGPREGDDQSSGRRPHPSTLLLPAKQAGEEDTKDRRQRRLPASHHDLQGDIDDLPIHHPLGLPGNAGRRHHRRGGCGQVWRVQVRVQTAAAQ